MNNTVDHHENLKREIKTQNIKNNAILLISLVLLILSAVLSGSEVLSQVMVGSICYIAMSLILWVFHPIPIGAVSLLVIVLQPLVGLSDSLNQSFSGFTNSANYFVIASFGFALALRKTKLSQRILIRLLKLCKEDSRKITLAFMAITFFLSSVMSDITAVVISVGFAMGLVELVDDQTKKNKFGKMILISLPIASLLGGTATPVGSTINVMALNILKEFNDINITFLQWTLLSFPIAIFMMFISWIIITKFYPSDNIKHSVIKKFEIETEKIQNNLRNEKLILLILFVVIVAWIISSWITILNTTTIAIIGLAVLMMPNVKAFTWEEFKMNVPWEIMLMGGAVISLGNIAVDKGLVSLVIQQVTGGFTSINPFTLIIVVGGMITLMLTLIP